MHNRAKQPNIPAELADNLIDSLGELAAIEGDELRRHVVMLINHSYALGYVAGAGAGLVARMQSRLARARRSAGRDIRLALSAIRERLTTIFRDHGRRIPAPIEAFSTQSTRSPGRYRSRYCTDVRPNVV